VIGFNQEEVATFVAVVGVLSVIAQVPSYCYLKLLITR